MFATLKVASHTIFSIMQTGKKGEKGKMPEKKFHHEAVKEMLNLADAKDLKRTLNSLMEKAQESVEYATFPEDNKVQFADFRVLHNFLARLMLYHEKTITAEDLLINP